MLHTLTQKVTAVAMVFLVLTATAATFAITSILSLQRAVTHLTTHVTQYTLTSHFDLTLNRALGAALFFSRFPTAEARTELQEVLSTLQADIVALNSLTPHEDIQAEEYHLLQTRREAVLARLELLAANLMQAAEAGDGQEVEAVLIDLARLDAETRALLRASEQPLQYDTSRALRETNRLIQQGVYSTIGSFFLSLSLILFALFAVQQQIARPLKKLSRAAGEVSRGRLDQGVIVTNTDEIGSLQRAFNEMLKGLTEQRRAFEAQAEAEQARAAAEEASHAKTLFLANMSHELRTPLNTIIGYGELLQEEAQEQGIQTFHPELTKILEASRHLLAIINDILSLSTIEAGRLELSPVTFEVAAVVRGVASSIAPLVERNHNTFEVRCPDDIGLIHADLSCLRQILWNLLSNAAKFTSQGAVVLAVQRTTEQGKEWLCFEVRDSGIGIQPEKLQEIFKPFSQADATMARRYGGTGLGLAISQRLAQLMGGSILVESQVGRGSTFTLQLPAGR